MKLIDLKCTKCNASLKINDNLNKYICPYCGNEMLLDNENIQHQITNGFDFGYQQEMGRLKAIEDMNRKKEQERIAYIKFMQEQELEIQRQLKEQQEYINKWFSYEITRKKKQELFVKTKKQHNDLEVINILEKQGYTLELLENINKWFSYPLTKKEKQDIWYKTKKEPSEIEVIFSLKNRGYSLEKLKSEYEINLKSQEIKEYKLYRTLTLIFVIGIPTLLIIFILIIMKAGNMI